MDTPTNPPASVPAQSPEVKGLTDLCADIFLELRWLRWLGRFLRCHQPVKAIAGGLKGHKRINVWLGTLFIWFIPAIIWSYADPFGVSNSSAAYSQLIIDRITAPFYHSPGQDRIAVVLIDDATLDQFEVGWPPPYDVYATLLYRILRQHPKTVFMDILLERLRTRDRDAYDRARKTLSKVIPRFNVPVVLGQSGPGADNLFADIDGVDTAMVSWASPEYPLWDSEAHRPTPAPLLYAHLCADAPKGTPWCHGPLAPDRAKPMAVQWGCEVSPIMRDRGLLPDNYEYAEPSLFERYRRAGSLLLHSLLVGIDQDAVAQVRERIPYALTVMAHDLDKPAVQGLLKDRAVLVGVSLPGSNDVVETPANGQLPGVYYHAMALDNLTRYGQHYYTNPPQSFLTFVAVALFISGLSVVMYARQGRLGFLYLFLSYSAILALVFLLHHAFRIAPQNWLGYFFLATLGKFIQTPDQGAEAPGHKECSP